MVLVPIAWTKTLTLPINRRENWRRYSGGSLEFSPLIPKSSRNKVCQGVEGGIEGDFGGTADVGRFYRGELEVGFV